MVLPDGRKKPNFSVLVDCFENGTCPVYIPPVNSYWHFQLYLHSLEKMIPQFFALDHFHYARWLSVHVSDMKMLEITEPGLYQVFNEFGCFIVSRTKKPFSSLGLDQRHEQHNKDVKGHGGVLGLTKVEEKL